MKTKLILLAFILLESNQLNAQTTPRGNPVTSCQRPEIWSYQDKLDWGTAYAIAYPNATEQGTATTTSTYNCHSYAWNMSEGGPTCWIGCNSTTNEDIYWNDQSYIETTEAYASKISYYADDHSARQTATQGMYISKWGDKVLMLHANNDGPAGYQMAYRKYYKLNPGIDGSSAELCVDQERTFTSNTSITGSTYSWTRDDNLLDYVSGAGTTDYRVKAKSGNFDAWVRLQVTTPSGEVATTSKKYFWVGKPYVNPATIQFTCVEGSGYLCTNAYGNEFSFYYTGPYNYFDIKLTNFSETQTLDEFTIYTTEGTIDYYPPEGTYKFMVRGNNDCGTAANWSKTTVDYVDCGGFRLLSLEIFPNPAADETIVSIVSSNEEIIAVDDTEEWDLEVYTQSQLLKLIKRKIKGPRYTLNTSGWQPGIYFVRVNYKDEILTKTLVVNK